MIKPWNEQVEYVEKAHWGNNIIDIVPAIHNPRIINNACHQLINYK